MVMLIVHIHGRMCIGRAIGSRTGTIEFEYCSLARLRRFNVGATSVITSPYNTYCTASHCAELLATLCPPTAPLNPCHTVYMPFTVTQSAVLDCCCVLVAPLHVAVDLLPSRLACDSLLELPPWLGASVPAEHAAYALLVSQ